MLTTTLDLTKIPRTFWKDKPNAVDSGFVSMDDLRKFLEDSGIKTEFAETKTTPVKEPTYWPGRGCGITKI